MGGELPHVMIAGQTLVPQPEHALLWVEQATLFVADLHIGKAATFRDHAIPIPIGTTGDDLKRLTSCLHRTTAQRLVVLGDLFHSSSAQDERFLGILRRWGADHLGLELTVVPGNHDLHAGPPHHDLGWSVVEEGKHLGPFCLRHHPVETEGAYVLAGHLHPKFSVRDGRESVRLACFHFSAGMCVLPAFSSFTGGWRVRPRQGDAVFVPVEETVIRVR